MRTLAEIDSSIEALLKGSPYAQSPEERHARLLPLLKAELAFACEQNPSYRNFVEHWPTDYRSAENVASLPYLSSGVFKANPPLALVDSSEILRTLSSSATSGQTPSRIALDRATAGRMTRSMALIVRDFIGAARRPYLVVDTSANLTSHAELRARGVAIQGLLPFATETVTCLMEDEHGNPALDMEALAAFAERWSEAEILIYGFTYVLWTCFVEPLRRVGTPLSMPNAFVLHSGGWKRLEELAVDHETFNQEVAAAIGCSPDRVIDYYGMVEDVGVVYPDCRFGNKHVPTFAEVVIRHPLTLQPVKAGEKGMLQFCSVLPTSFPGFLVLTDDVAEFIDDDGCPCGRRGTCFRFAGRVPKTEMRGCGNLAPAREPPVRGTYA